MFRNFESVYEILRYGTFFSKNCYKVKYFFGDILFAYLMAALARLSRADPMNDAHYNVTKLNHFMYTPKRSCQEHMAEIYRWDPICCSSCFLELAHLFEVSNLPPAPAWANISSKRPTVSRIYDAHPCRRVWVGSFRDCYKGNWSKFNRQKNLKRRFLAKKKGRKTDFESLRSTLNFFYW